MARRKEKLVIAPVDEKSSNDELSQAAYMAAQPVVDMFFKQIKSLSRKRRTDGATFGTMAPAVGLICTVFSHGLAGILNTDCTYGLGHVATWQACFGQYKGEMYSGKPGNFFLELKFKRKAPQHEYTVRKEFKK